jgi:hypothetical protein
MNELVWLFRSLELAETLVLMQKDEIASTKVIKVLENDSNSSIDD